MKKDNPNDIFEKQEFTKEKFDISEELVEDFSYFYKDEEDILANEKLKRKYRLFSGLIIASLVILTIFILGGIRMATYRTTEIVTNTFVKEYDFKENTEDIYFYCLDFHDGQRSGTYLNIKNNTSLVENEIDIFKDYYEIVYNIEIPLKEDDSNYTNYVTYKESLIEQIKSAQTILEKLKEDELSEELEETLLKNYVNLLDDLSVAYAVIYN